MTSALKYGIFCVKFFAGVAYRYGASFPSWFRRVRLPSPAPKIPVFEQKMPENGLFLCVFNGRITVFYHLRGQIGGKSYLIFSPSDIRNSSERSVYAFPSAPRECPINNLRAVSFTPHSTQRLLNVSRISFNVCFGKNSCSFSLIRLTT